MKTPSRLWNWLQELGRDMMEGAAMAGCSYHGIPYPPEILAAKFKREPEATATPPAPPPATNQPR